MIHILGAPPNSADVGRAAVGGRGPGDAKTRAQQGCRKYGAQAGDATGVAATAQPAAVAHLTLVAATPIVCVRPVPAAGVPVGAATALARERGTSGVFVARAIELAEGAAVGEDRGAVAGQSEVCGGSMTEHLL